MQLNEITAIEKRVDTLERLLGSSNAVVDGEEIEVKLEPVLKRLNDAKEFRSSLNKNGNINEFMELYTENNEVIDKFSSYSRSLSSIVDESRYLLVVSEKIQNFVDLVRKVKIDADETNEENDINIEEKDQQISEAYQKNSLIFIKSKQCGEVIDSLLQQYNDFITVLNKRMIYLDHLITQKEKERGLGS